MAETHITLPAENWICCQYKTHWLACPHATELNVRNAPHVQALHKCNNEDIKSSNMGAFWQTCLVTLILGRKILA